MWLQWDTGVSFSISSGIQCQPVHSCGGRALNGHAWLFPLIRWLYSSFSFPSGARRTPRVCIPLVTSIHVIVRDVWKSNPQVRCISGSSAFDFVIQGIPASVKLHWISYQKHLTVAYSSSHSHFCAVAHIVCINIANKRPRCNAHSDVSSTKASP
jgi:hypothetical protein